MEMENEIALCLGYGRMPGFASMLNFNISDPYSVINAVTNLSAEYFDNMVRLAVVGVLEIEVVTNEHEVVMISHVYDGPISHPVLKEEVARAEQRFKDVCMKIFAPDAKRAYVIKVLSEGGYVSTNAKW